MEENKIKLTIIFGTEACDAYDDYGFIAAKNCADSGDGDILEKYFNTEGEKAAYLEGLADMDGWEASWPLTEKEVEEDIARHTFSVGEKVHWNDPAIREYDDPEAAYNRVFIIDSIEDNETAWLREDGDVFANTEVYLSELDKI